MEPRQNTLCVHPFYSANKKTTFFEYFDSYLCTKPCAVAGKSSVKTDIKSWKRASFNANGERRILCVHYNFGNCFNMRQAYWVCVCAGARYVNDIQIPPKSSACKQKWWAAAHNPNMYHPPARVFAKSNGLQWTRAGFLLFIHGFHYIWFWFLSIFACNLGGHIETLCRIVCVMHAFDAKNKGNKLNRRKKIRHACRAIQIQ